MNYTIKILDDHLSVAELVVCSNISPLIGSISPNLFVELEIAMSVFEKIRILQISSPTRQKTRIGDSPKNLSIRVNMP